MPPDIDMIGEHEIDMIGEHEIDMIGEHEIGALELQIGHGHVVYTGGAKGTDELVE